MKDNIYPYIIDFSFLDGKIIVYELQPLLSSNIGGNSSWGYEDALEKAFPGRNITINSQGEKTKVTVGRSAPRILITSAEDVSFAEFAEINSSYYQYVHTASFEAEIDHLNNKVLQRLYLPDEVSPEYCILKTSLATEELARKVFDYFTAQGIKKIVLKAAVNYEGKGNIFINDIQDKQSLQQGIEKLQSINKNIKYFLAEEQKIFSRISQKTGEEKPGYRTYRLLGIASEAGDIGHFIATQSIATSIDSHQRAKMKCYFGKRGETYQDKGWLLEACGTKDKYIGSGENPSSIIMDKLSKCIYQLYIDIKAMNDTEFEQHIDQLVAQKSSLSSSKKTNFSMLQPKKNADELVNSTDLLLAFARARYGYPELANDIAQRMISADTIDLSKLMDLPFYNHANDLQPFLKAIVNQEKFERLQTANLEQLSYCIDNYGILYQAAEKIIHTKEIEVQKKNLKTISSAVSALFTIGSNKELETTIEASLQIANNC